MGALFSLEVAAGLKKDRQRRGLKREVPWSSVLSGGLSCTEERQAEVRLRSGGPLGALFSLEAEAGLKEARQR